ncbi:MAG: hypothetical protein QXV22_04385, partial [Thermoplasmataceae archaeon]
ISIMVLQHSFYFNLPLADFSLYNTHWNPFAQLLFERLEIISNLVCEDMGSRDPNFESETYN